MHGRAKKTLKRCIGARALARARATQRADRDRLLKGVLGSELELPSCKATNLPPSVFWPEGVRKHKITTVKVSAKYAYFDEKKYRQMTAGSYLVQSSVFTRVFSSSRRVNRWKQWKVMKVLYSYWKDENLYLPKWLCNLKKILMPIDKNCFRKILLK